MTFRTDANLNPAAFTTDIAKEAGLTLGVDYTQGDPFQAGGHVYYTARLIGDPIAVTIRVIDKLGYKTKGGTERWTYICIPKFVWDGLSADEKRDVIGYHYRYEGGSTMKPLFPNYGQA